MKWEEWVTMGREDMLDHPVVGRVGSFLEWDMDFQRWFGMTRNPPSVVYRIIATYALSRSLAVIGSWNLKPIKVDGGKEEIDSKVGVPGLTEGMLNNGLGWRERTTVVLFDQHHSFKHSFTDESVRRYAKEKASRLAASRNNLLDGLATTTKRITRGDRGDGHGQGQ